ncbi:MAG: accessory Sec system protein translocase subunit SecY2 [Lachnospiraceae bacterium]|nr:accessory Sec system protein translocase subunit SecY2 [Lachnospiraceae bacterium]
MENNSESHDLVKQKLLFTLMIIAIYVLGRKIPMCGLVPIMKDRDIVDMNSFMMSTIGGDINGRSVFALGLSPYMISSILVQAFYSIKNDGTGSSSPARKNRLTAVMVFVIAFIQAVLRLRHLEFEMNRYTDLNMLVAVLEMVTGAVVIMWLASRNKTYGAGGQTVLIFVNILDTFFTAVNGHSFMSLVPSLVMGLILMMLTVFMEYSEFRIPVQRISIHNIYADKNYMAFKLNVVGVMPIMFSSAVFMLPQMIVNALLMVMPDDPDIIWLSENLTLLKPLGTAVYIIIIYLITVFLAFVMVNPRDLSEQYLKSGDSLVDIRAGKDTKNYLLAVILIMCTVNGTVLSLCIGIPMYVCSHMNLDSSLISIPSTAMMLASLWCNIREELVSVRTFDSYEAFI